MLKNAKTGTAIAGIPEQIPKNQSITYFKYLIEKGQNKK
jgi:hypothetical protein